MDESPFLLRKKVFRREETYYERYVLRSIEEFKSAFVGAIPSDEVKQLPPSYKYTVGSLVFIVLTIIFVAVFVPGTPARALCALESNNLFHIMWYQVMLLKFAPSSSHH